MLIQAIKDKVLVKVLKEETTTKGGLIVPGTIRKDPQKYGTVISVGQDVRHIGLDVTLVFHERGGQVILIDEEEYRILNEAEIYGVVVNKDSSDVNGTS
jgi:chaperonin GroES